MSSFSVIILFYCFDLLVYEQCIIGELLGLEPDGFVIRKGRSRWFAAYRM